MSISSDFHTSNVVVTARVISGVASHIQVEETEALHVSRIALMVRGYLRSECVKELLSQAQDSSLTHSTLQLRATMSAIRHPCLIMGQCPSNFEGRNTLLFIFLSETAYITSGIGNYAYLGDVIYLGIIEASFGASSKFYR